MVESYPRIFAALCEKDSPGIWALNVIVRLLEGWDSGALEGGERETCVYHSGVRGQNSPGCDRTDRHFLSRTGPGCWHHPQPPITTYPV